MAVRFDAAADRLLRTTDLPDCNAAYTWMAWIYLVSDLNAVSNLFVFSDNSNGITEAAQTANDGVTLQINVRGPSGTGTVNGTLLNVGQWYHVAMVRETTTSVKIYLDGVLDATSTIDVSTRGAATRMEHGAKFSGNQQRSDSRQFAIKFWSTNLSLAEIQNEMRTIRPHRTANLYGWWPCFPGATERLRDYSGNSRDWTEGGTLTDEDPPPLGWGAQAYLVQVAAAGGPTTFFLEVSGAVTPTGALIKQVNTAYTGQVGPTGEPDQSVLTAFSGAVTPTGALAVARTAVLSLAGAVTATGALIIQAGKLLSGTVTPTGAIVKQVQTAYTGQAGPTGEPDLGVQTTFAGSVTSSGALTVIRAVLISLSGAVTPDGTLVKQVNTAYTGQTTPTGEPDQSVQTSLAGSVTPTATLVAIKIILLTVSGSVTPTGSLVNQVGKFLGGAIVGAGALIKQVQTAYSGQVGPGGDPDLGVQTSLAGSVTPTGSLTTVPIIGGVVTIIQVLFKGMYKGMFKKAR
ncbi:MAG TPA: LamG-like jellyroll fold domain-containing protein [Anaerolineae bacterium]|nr:LamG-like jellyroll fold domain-containing protein [Anaerolineae bacterium]